MLVSWAGACQRAAAGGALCGPGAGPHAGQGRVRRRVPRAVAQAARRGQGAPPLGCLASAVRSSSSERALLQLLQRMLVISMGCTCKLVAEVGEVTRSGTAPNALRALFVQTRAPFFTCDADPMGVMRQVIDDGASVRTRGGVPLEAVITEGLAHSGVVNTLAHAMVARRARSTHDSAGSRPASSCAAPSSGSSGPAATSAASGVDVLAESWPPDSDSAAEGADRDARGLDGQAWLLLEYCDKGCLQARLAPGATSVFSAIVSGVRGMHLQGSAAMVLRCVSCSSACLATSLQVEGCAA